MKFFKKKFKTKRNHKVFDLAYFPSLTFISRLTHQLHTFLGFFDEYVDFGDKTFACGHYDVFFLFKSALHDPQGFDLVSHTISLMEKFPW